MKVLFNLFILNLYKFMKSQKKIKWLAYILKHLGCEAWLIRWHGRTCMVACIIRHIMMYVDVNLIPNGKAWTVSQHENDGKIACVFNRRGD